MRVLVTYASLHTSTAEIAEAIGHVLSDAAPADTLDVLPVENADDIEDYDAVVIGSAIYDGRWLEPAREFVHANCEQLATLPVWLFSSGPLGESLVHDTDVQDVSGLAELIQARGQKLFAGQLRLADLELDERSTVRQVHGVEGDYRDWRAIRAWAAEVADSLSSTFELVEPGSNLDHDDGE
jgi:menaquinone-dependent protoporphyrinogen oxidase